MGRTLSFPSDKVTFGSRRSTLDVRSPEMRQGEGMSQRNSGLNLSRASVREEGDI